MYFDTPKKREKPVPAKEKQDKYIFYLKLYSIHYSIHNLVELKVAKTLVL